jgi:hypothetical protein
MQVHELQFGKFDLFSGQRQTIRLTKEETKAILAAES